MYASTLQRSLVSGGSSGGSMSELYRAFPSAFIAACCLTWPEKKDDTALSKKKKQQKTPQKTGIGLLYVFENSFFFLIIKLQRIPECQKEKVKVILSSASQIYQMGMNSSATHSDPSDCYQQWGLYPSSLFAVHVLKCIIWIHRNVKEVGLYSIYGLQLACYYFT